MSVSSSLGSVLSWLHLSLRWSRGLLSGPQVIALNAFVISFLHEMVSRGHITINDTLDIEHAI